MGGCCASKNVGNPAAAAPPPTKKPEDTTPKPQEVPDNSSDNTRVPSDSSNGFHTVLRILEGVLIGFLGESLPKVLESVTEAHMVFDDFKAAVETYQQGDAIKALGQLGRTLKALGSLLEDAGLAAEEVQRFVDALAMLDDPAKIVFHIGEELLVNGRDILARIEAAVSAFNAHEWEKFGKEIGAIIGEVVSPASTSREGAGAPAPVLEGGVAA